VTTSRTRLFAALAFVLPVAALVATPAMATGSQKSQHHSSSTHKASQKSSHKSKTSQSTKTAS
jgi:hypothetical protein